MKDRIYISPVDLLMEIDILEVKDYKSWRLGNVPYLEKVCKTNLSKLSFILEELRKFAQENHLKPSKTVYNQWGTKGRKISLRFSKSNDSAIETAYATHYVGSIKK